MQLPDFLLCIDPGLLTGIVLIDLREDQNPQVAFSGEYSVPDFHDTVERILAEMRENVVVVCENFIITPGTAKLSQAPWSLRGVGVTEFLCRKYHAQMVLQQPAQAKEISADELHTAGFWHVGGDGHANDAFRHAVVFLKVRQRKWARIFL